VTGGQPANKRPRLPANSSTVSLGNPNKPSGPVVAVGPRQSEGVNNASQTLFKKAKSQLILVDQQTMLDPNSEPNQSRKLLTPTLAYRPFNCLLR